MHVIFGVDVLYSSEQAPKDLARIIVIENAIWPSLHQVLESPIRGVLHLYENVVICLENLTPCHILRMLTSLNFTILGWSISLRMSASFLST